MTPDLFLRSITATGYKTPHPELLHAAQAKCLFNQWMQCTYLSCLTFWMMMFDLVKEWRHVCCDTHITFQQHEDNKSCFTRALQLWMFLNTTWSSCMWEPDTNQTLPCQSVSRSESTSDAGKSPAVCYTCWLESAEIVPSSCVKTADVFSLIWVHWKMRNYFVPALQSSPLQLFREIITVSFCMNICLFNSVSTEVSSEIYLLSHITVSNQQKYTVSFPVLIRITWI